MPVTLEDVIMQMEALAPQELAATWDNSGLLFGAPQREIHRVLLALEADSAVVAEAKDKACELVIVHHPLVFQPLKKLVAGEYVSDVFTELIKNDIACYAAHTNLDVAPQGVNFALATTLGMENMKPLVAETQEIPCYIGELPQALEWQALITMVKKALKIDTVKAVPQSGLFRTLAVCGGAGMGFWQEAKQVGADCLISADSSYHEGIAAAHAGIALIDAGHYDTEKIIIPHLAEYLHQKLPQLTCCISEVNTNPWKNF